MLPVAQPMDRSGKNLYNSNMAAALEIRNYNLFGEVAGLPDIVHCETISARSRLHDWTFAPHRHISLHQILLVSRGGGRALIEDRALRLRKGDVVNMPAGAVHGYAFERGTEGYVVTLASEMIDQMVVPGEGLARALRSAALLRSIPSIRTSVADIFEEFSGRGFGRAHMLRSLCATLLGLVARGLAEQNELSHGGDATLLRRFEALLEENYRRHWSVSDYASALAISPTHLSRLARAGRGSSAGGLIAERLMREARRNLVYTDLPVSTISYALGFDDPAYFSRVFSRAIGLSPRRFRDRFQSAMRSPETAAE